MRCTTPPPDIILARFATFIGSRGEANSLDAVVRIRRPDRPCAQSKSFAPQVSAFASQDMSSLRSIAETIRRLGLVDGSLWATARVVSKASGNRFRLYRYYFVAQPVAARALAPSRGSSAVTLRWTEPGDPLIAQFPRPREVIAERYRMGAVCLTAEKAGKFVGFIWLKEHAYFEDEVRCHYVLEPAGICAWDFDVYIEPGYRFGRAFVRLWDGANVWLRERGCQWCLSRISAFNPESMAAHDRLGTRRMGSATFLRLGSLQVAFLDRAPFLHIGWRSEQAPTLRLAAPEF
jgi:hypothetical protein